ncbi:MAG TPA: LytTR family DNA-binding domain-containing protein [Opitutaceae bacterium]|nr:LytTR family DNA-binding domain-containing protein [Opitutaceae bacterium]
MSPLRVLIVDDEPLARDNLAVLLRADPEVELAGTCADGQAALAEIRARRPDLVFLDVQMPRLGGLEVFAQLAPAERPAVVFVTAYDQYAVQAFEMCAVDYLLKPFRDARFRAALDRAKQEVRRASWEEMQRRAKALLDHLRHLEGAASAPPPEAPGTAAGATRLVFRVGREHVFIEAADIAWIEAQGDFIKLRAAGQTHLIRESLQGVEKRLDPARFVRIHRSFIVNTGCVRKITPALYGDYDVLTTDGTKIRLSRTFRDKLKVLLSAQQG